MFSGSSLSRSDWQETTGLVKKLNRTLRGTCRGAAVFSLYFQLPPTIYNLRER